jgi:hypothetical protein
MEKTRALYLELLRSQEELLQTEKVEIPDDTPALVELVFSKPLYIQLTPESRGQLKNLNRHIQLSKEVHTNIEYFLNVVDI